MARGKGRGTAGADMMVRHLLTGLTCRPLIAKIELNEHGDPGPFRGTQHRKLDVGEEARHVIVGGVYAHTKVQWAITADSQSEAEIEYWRDGKWRSSATSKIYGDAPVAASMSSPDDLARARAEHAPANIEDYLRSADFLVRHNPDSERCINLPHEVKSQILAGGFHPRINLPTSLSAEVTYASSYTKCR